MELKDLRGLGSARLAALENAGIRTLDDLISVYPAAYRDTSRITPISCVCEGAVCCVSGTLEAAPKLSFFNRLARVTAVLHDSTGSIQLMWYNQPWLQKQLHAGQELLLYGKPERGKNGRLQLVSPSIEHERAIIPVYKPPAGIPPKIFAGWVAQALSQMETCCPETLPPALRSRYRLCERNFALRQIHHPDTMESLHAAQQRLAFEQLLLYQAALSTLRSRPGKALAIPFSETHARSFWQSLPFPATAAQLRVFHDIQQDMARSSPMRRMVQGDVGCGKTAIAFAAMYCCARAGLQSALMAPTEILARQHLESARQMLEPLGIRCGLLLGGMKAKERREALENIRSGAWQVVIGTHALLSEGIHYHNLSLVITDEQHRFGVTQRHRLSQKALDGQEAHVLVMSATPIPRSLALILFGDLDISIVDELPPGRTPVRTRIVPEAKREALYRFIRTQAAEGRQTYIVCPLVEESETMQAQSAQDLYAELCCGPLSALRLGLTYGTQDSAEKARVLSAFAAGEIDVLVATTVIEVGVNVPNATVMVIENADRFGLSQLHQLRGRVGRGSQESWCFLMGEANERLTALCATNDGFVIANKDLEMRGPGEFLGTAQHGTGIFSLLAADPLLLQQTQECLRWLESDPAQNEGLAQVQAHAQQLFAARLNQIALN